MNVKTWMGGALALGLVACDQGGGAGTVRGRVLDSSGQPVRNARVMLDARDGRATMTNALGEFQLGGASAGDHKVLALAASIDAGASVAVTVEDGAVIDIGNVTVVDCVETQPADGSTEPGDPSDPCSYEPPPPPPDSVTIPSLSAEFGDAFVDGHGVYGYLHDEDTFAALDFWFAGDFTAGGTKTVDVADATTGFYEGHAGLFTYDSYGYYYSLVSGQLTITVTDDGDADPTTMSFSFSGSNLEFAYMDWYGGVGGQTASVGAATGSGLAWIWLPPEPPTEDITIATLVPDWKEIYLCAACAMDGTDALYVYAFDSTNGADLGLFLPINALVVPGSASVSGSWDGSTGVFGGASVYSANGGGWYYDLDTATISVGSSAIVAGQPLSLSLSNGVFEYFDYGGVVVNDQGEPVEPQSDLHLFIGSADLSADVTEMGCADPGEPTEAPPAAGN